MVWVFLNMGHTIVTNSSKDPQKQKYFGFPILFQRHKKQHRYRWNKFTYKSSTQNVLTQSSSIAPIIVSDFVIKLLLYLWMLLKIFVCCHGTDLSLSTQCTTPWRIQIQQTSEETESTTLFFMPYLQLLDFGNFFFQSFRLLQRFLFCFFQFHQLQNKPYSFFIFIFPLLQTDNALFNLLLVPIDKGTTKWGPLFLFFMLMIYLFILPLIQSSWNVCMPCRNPGISRTQR